MFQECSADGEVLQAVGTAEVVEVVVDLVVAFLHEEVLHLAASVEDSVDEHEAMPLIRVQRHQSESISYRVGRVIN